MWQEKKLKYNTMRYDLSIILPAANEMFLKNTVEDIIKHKEARTEIIVVLDGAWSDPPLENHPDVKIIFFPESIGQRAATNMGVRISKARYIIKADSHCAFDQGFDRKMLEFFKEVGDDVVAVPVMRNLHAFNWVCPDGHSRYQGISGQCVDCGKETTRDVVWISKTRPESTSYCFDSTPHFQYANEFKRRPEYLKDVKEKGYNETMNLQGSFFMSTRHNYWKYQLCDERMGNWGNQAIEVACAAWLSGLRVLCNHKTWYSHLFRTKGGDFGFPWQAKDKDIQKTKNAVKDKFWNKKHPKQIHPVSWLLERFWPIPGWTDEQLQQLKEHEKML
jgi:glycosyltransferase involved in cell wall biosynthesis